MFKKLFLFLLLLSPLASIPAQAADKIKVVATTRTLASITQEIVRDKAEVYSIASPHRDIHFVTPTPKDVMKMQAADVFVHGGLDLEAWRGPLVDAVGRSEFLWPGGEKQIDVSKGIHLLEIPASLSRIQGDIHAYGNPHYWLDPLNAKIIAQNIAEELGRIYPEDADLFRRNAKEFQNKIDQKMKEWESQAAPYKGSPLVVYHNTWPYFMERFGFAVLGFLEPQPGIPPTARHLQELTRIMKEKTAKVIVKEIFHESRAPKKLAKETGASILTLDTETGAVKADYFSLIDHNLQELIRALQSSKKGSVS